MKKSLLLTLVAILTIAAAHAQQVRPAGSAEIYRSLKTLKNLTRVMYLAAHPDDENTGLLSWLVNDQNLQTAYLSLTRGDGGQNLLGKEQGAALGLIRTHELLEARKLDGAGQYFSRAIDFGFSKNTDDTFKQWDADSITADVVWVIRKFRPDVIICRFPPTAAAGHGQHAASAVVAEKAFKAAADPKMFPEQLKYLQVWQPKRVVWNIFRFTPDQGAPSQVTARIGNYDPRLGLGYGELAGISRSLHKSQGAGTQSVPGVRTEYFSHVAGDQATKSIFDGITKTWTAIGNGDIDTDLAKLIKDFNFNAPEESIPGLLDLRKKILVIKDQDIRGNKLRALDEIIRSCAGFMAEAVTTVPEAVAGEQLNFKINLIARAGVPVSLESIGWLSNNQDIKKLLPNDSLITIPLPVAIPADARLSEPYWLASAPRNAAQFSVPNDTLIGLAEQAPELKFILKVKIGTTIFNVDLPLSYKKLDPVKGDVIEPLRIIPAVNVKFIQPLYFAKENLPLQVGVRLTSGKILPAGTIAINLGNKTIARSELTAPNTKDTVITVTLNKEVPAQFKNGQAKLEAVFSASGRNYSKNQQVIQYSHLPTLQYFTTASANVISGDIKVTAQKIGYIEGAGDLIPDFLTEAGIQVDVLTEADVFNSTRLAAYDAIVTGVRVVNTEKRIKNWLPALREYVKNGGTLIMQYNTTQDMATQDFAIYPLTLSSLRVTEENSAVKFLAPQHKLLNSPNKITKSDFDNWVQERGTYFASQWDKKYEPLFEMHDTGEAPLQGSVLTAKYFKGTFIYASLAFFRQLPAGNAGAARLFFNFISAGKP